MNCLIYLRVSTKEQAETDGKEGYSIPAQREACLRYIKERGWNFVDEFVDRGESARSSLRPQLQELLSRVKKDPSIDAVVVHKIDRLARNLEDHVAIKAILKRKDVALFSVVENIEDSASGRLIEGIHALMAEFYSSNLAMEVKKGINQKVKLGGWPTKAPLGYKNIKLKIEGREIATVTPDEEKAPLIQLAFKLYATGEYSLSELLETLTDKGLRGGDTKAYSGKPISKSHLASLLQNKFYIGIVPWKGLEVEGRHERLIDKDLFETVQEVLKAHDQAGERKRKHPHYLRGTLYCGECGSRLSSSTAKGQYTYFYCLGQKRHNGCKQQYVLADLIEKLVEDLYKDIELPQSWVEELSEMSRQELVEREIDIVRQQEFLNKRVSKLMKERQKILEAYLAEALPLDLLKQEQNRISSELRSAETQLDALSLHNDQIEKLIEDIALLASNCHAAYLKASPSTRRLFNQAFFEKIYIKDKKISDKKFTDLFDAIFNSSSSNKNSLVGFTGSETAREQRNWMANVTILDGNQQGSVVYSPPGVTSTARIDGFTIRNGTGNTFDGTDWKFGGGILCMSSSPTIANNTISGNSAGASIDVGFDIEFENGEGGGIACLGYSSPIISNNTISDNTSKSGGGIFIATSESASVQNNIIKANQAQSGGGIFITQDNRSIIASNLIALNYVNYQGQGGGIFSIGGYQGQVINNTIVKNRISIYDTDGYGGGIYCADSSPVVSNNIIAFNYSGICSFTYNSPGAMPILRNNDIYGNNLYNYSGLSAGQGDISVDPVFVDKTNDDYHITPNSPCVDSGDDTVVQSSWTDIDGQPRSQGAHIDIGADEIIFDITAPTAWATPSGGIYNTAQSVTLTASEPASIYYTTDGSTPTASSIQYIGAPINIMVSTVLKFIAIDNAGNQSPIYAENYTIDTEAPVTTITLEGSLGGNGWYTSDVTVTLSAVDPGGSGVAETMYSFDGTNWNTYLAPLCLNEEGIKTIYYRSVDIAGNIENTKTCEVKIDKTPPLITVNSPVDGTEYLLNQLVFANWIAEDPISGILSAIGTVASGQPIDTASAGTKIFSVDATNTAGMHESRTISYQVRYSYIGVLQPIKQDGSSIFRTGKNRVIPVKFQLMDAGGSYVSSAVARLYYAKVLDNVTGTVLAANTTGNANTDNLFRYDSADNLYIYNLDTNSLSTGTWELQIVLDDGTTKTVSISVK